MKALFVLFGKLLLALLLGLGCITGLIGLITAGVMIWDMALYLTGLTERILLVVVIILVISIYIGWELLFDKGE